MNYYELQVLTYMLLQQQRKFEDKQRQQQQQITTQTARMGIGQTRIKVGNWFIRIGNTLSGQERKLAAEI